MTIRFHEFTDFKALTEALCAEWMQLIAASANGSSFALAGGSTPAPVYQRLDELLAVSSSAHPVRLVATDERWVADADNQSNEGLFRRCLSQSARDRRWQLISLKNAAGTPEIATEAIHERLQQAFPAPFTGILLGMGSDGHIASLFPGAPTQHDELDCLAAVHPQTRQCRMSLSLPRLLNSERIWLVISGQEKRDVLDRAAQQAAGSTLPVSALLQQNRTPVEVFWCP